MKYTKYTKYTTLLLLILLVSCAESQKSPEPKKSTLIKLAEGQPLKCTEFKEELIMTNPLSIELIGDYLYLFQHKGENAAFVFDVAKDKILGTWGGRGGGPGEFNLPMFWGNRVSTNQVFLYDLDRFTLREYANVNTSDKSDLIFKGEKKFPPNHAAFKWASALENGNFVTSSSYNLDRPLLLLSSNLDSICSFGDIPDDEHRSIDLRSYWGRTSSYKNKFVYAMSELGYLVCYEQASPDKVEKLWERFLQLPIYKGNQLDPTKVLRGFVDVKMTPNYIFCSYSGKEEKQNDTSPEKILVFDHQGQLIKHFQLDRNIGKIAVSADEKTIYAISYDNDIMLVKYEVGKYL